MPARLLNAARPTFYLDQSVISDAYRSTAQYDAGADPGYAPLRSWIERVAEEANLCFSTAHIIETARLAHHASVTAEGMMLWLESLPAVWVRSMQDVDLEEEEYWTKIAAGVKPSRPVVAFTNDVKDAFAAMKNDLGALAVATEFPGSIIPFYETARDLLDLDKYGTNMREIALGLKANESVVVDWTKKEKGEDLALNRRCEIRRDAWKAIERMNARNDVDLTEPLSFDLVDDVVALYEKNPRALPGTRVQTALVGALAKSYRAKSVFDEGELGGDFFDYQHLSVAGAYCDVFTCDGKVASAIASARMSIGRSAPFTRKKHPRGTSGFVHDLMATWPNLPAASSD